MSAFNRTAAAVATLLLLGSQSAGAAPGDGSRPGFLKGPILSTAYDGVSDDLLTGGLGKTGLAGACPAPVATPTAAQLRVLAICNNYKALVNVTAKGGYGRSTGPMSMPSATSPRARARSPARSISSMPTTAAAERT